MYYEGSFAGWSQKSQDGSCDAWGKKGWGFNQGVVAASAERASCPGKIFFLGGGLACLIQSKLKVFAPFCAIYRTYLDINSLFLKKS